MIIVGLLFLAQSVGALPSTVPADMLAPSQTLISYQGMLTDENGNLLTATVTMKFALYDAPTGGTLKWGIETQTVQVANGLFHVLLGSVTPIDPTELGGDLYLDIEVNGEQMAPREAIGGVVRAALAAGSDGDFIVDGNVGIGISNPDSKLHIAASEGTALTVTGGAISLWGPVGIHDNAYLSGSLSAQGGGSFGANLDMNGNNIVDVGRIAVNTTSTAFGQVTIHASATPLSFKETDQTGAGSLWRMPVDGRNLRFDASQNGSDFAGYITPLTLHADGSIGCGAITENNLQTEEERAAGRSDRFEEGDVLCWSAEAHRLEKCATPSDPMIQAVADTSGRPIVIGAEPVKVIGPVRAGDYLVASSVPGYAMAAPNPTFGTVIAQALEDFDGERGIIKAMIRKM